MRKEILTAFVVYEKPSDFPNSFVVRRCVSYTTDDKTVQTEWDTLPLAVGPTLEAVRLALPKGSVLIPRDPDDDPVIVETWL